MALFRDNKFYEIEKKYLNGQRFLIGNHSFSLTLSKIVPYPTEILQYDWRVTLSDGYEFDAPMGAKTISYFNR